MLIEFFGGVVIKVKIKGFLKNLTENEEEIINTSAIIKSNTINYINNDIKYKLILEENQVILQRENNEFTHKIIFNKIKKHKSEYYVKGLHHSLEFNIETLDLKLIDKKLNITYKVLETENIYNYVIETSDKI